MGEEYRQTSEQKIEELGAENLRAFINHEAVNPHYRQHLEDTFRDAGVRFVANHADANLMFEGSQTPSYEKGQIVAFFQENRLMFARAL